MSDSAKPPPVPNNASQATCSQSIVTIPAGKPTANQQLSRISEDSKQSHLSPQVEDPPTTLNLLLPAPPPVPAAGPQPRFAPMLRSCLAS